MDSQPFHFEIKDMVTQFIAAFDDVVINRYNKERQIGEKINVRYVYAPKQKVIYDIVNSSQNITLPVIAVWITNVARSSERIHGKLKGTYVSEFIDGIKDLKHIPPHQAVDVNIKMAIIGKYQLDIEQIISNFAVYTNPYIIISWLLPKTLGIVEDVEIRTEVEWKGDVNVTYPVEQSPSTKYNIVAESNFTLKGLLFPAASAPAGMIYNITGNFLPQKDIKWLTSEDITLAQKDIIKINGVPKITDYFIKLYNGSLHRIEEVNDLYGYDEFLVYGYGFDWIDKITTGDVLPASAVNVSGALVDGGSLYDGPLSGTYITELSANNTEVHIFDKNILKIKLPSPLTSEQVLIFHNKAGYLIFPYNNQVNNSVMRVELRRGDTFTLYISYPENEPIDLTGKVISWSANYNTPNQIWDYNSNDDPSYVELGSWVFGDDSFNIKLNIPAPETANFSQGAARMLLKVDDAGIINTIANIEIHIT